MQGFSHVLLDFLASFTFSLMKNLPVGRQGRQGRQGNKKSRQNYGYSPSRAHEGFAVPPALLQGKNYCKSRQAPFA